MTVQIFFPPEIPMVGDIVWLKTTASAVPPGWGWTLAPGCSGARRRWWRVVTDLPLPYPGYSWGVRHVDEPAS